MKVLLGGGAPMTLASGQHYVAGIAVDATSLYWTHGWDIGTIMKMPIDGGAPTTLAAEQIAPGAIAVDAISVYWTTSDSIRKAPK